MRGCRLQAGRWQSLPGLCVSPFFVVLIWLRKVKSKSVSDIWTLQTKVRMRGCSQKAGRLELEPQANARHTRPDETNQ